MRLRAAPRARPEIFGLSTLDTVTCALGGSIILMILMAALTPREAPVALNETRIILQSGSGDGGGEPSSNALRNLFIVIIEYDDPPDDLANPQVSTSECEGAVSVRTLYTAIAHRPQHRDGQRRVGYMVWHRPPQVDDPPPCQEIGLTVADTSSRCQALLISGGHYSERSYDRCPSRFVFDSVEGQVFNFKYPIW